MKKFYSLIKATAVAGAFIMFAGTAQAFPTLDEIASLEGNEYTFTSSMTTVNTGGNFAPTSSFNFKIVLSGGVPQLEGFITTGYPMPSSYDASTGVLTFTYTYRGNSVVGNYAFVPGGVWNGYNNTTKLTLSFNADGTEISIPDFSFTKMSGLQMGDILAEYTNCKATPSNGGGGSGSGGSDEGPIVGIWEFQTQDPYLERKSTPSPATYEATLSGDQVTFTLQSEYDSSVLGDVFVATLGEDGTLTFEKTVVPSAAQVYKQYQVPFTNGAASGVSINSLNENTFTAQYSETDGTITFAADQATGLRFANLDASGNFAPDTDWQVAFNFVSASKVGDFAPEITLTAPLGIYYTIGDTFVTATYNLSTTHFDWDQNITWTAYASEVQSQEGDDDISVPVDSSNISVQVENGKAIITINGLSEKTYTFQVYIVASVDGEAYATSNERSLTITVGPNIMIRAPKATTEDDTATITAGIVALTGMPSDVVYKLLYYPFDDIYPSSATDKEQTFENEKSVTATVEGSNFVAEISDLTPGSYNYAFRIAAYKADGTTQIFASDFLPISFAIEDPTAPKLTISDVSGNLDEATGDYSISFSVALKNIEESEVAKYVANFSYPDHEKGGAANRSEEVELGSDGIVSIVLDNMPEGSYAVNITLAAYDSNDAVIAVSNELILSSYTTGVSTVGTQNGPVRYFNLNGVEVTNPQRGIYIRVQDGKATKIVR